MSSLQNLSAEDFAKLLYHCHESLAHDFQDGAGVERDCTWDETSQTQRNRMITAAD